MEFTRPIKCGGYNTLFTPTGGVETNVGSTQAGSQLFVIPSSFDRVIHRYGTTPHDKKSTGWDIRLEAIYLQQDFDKFRLLLSAGVITSGGSVATGALDGGIDDAVTVIPLVALTGFESPPDTGYVVEIEDEHVLVKFVNTSTSELGSTEFPCVRGYNGTTAVAHVDTTVVTRLDTVIDLNPIPQSFTKGGLILRPVGLIVESNDDINIYKASIEPNFSPVLSITEDQAFAAMFKGQVDENGLGQIRLMRFGKASVLPDKSRFPQA